MTLQGGESDLLMSHAWESEGKTSMRVLRRAVGGVADHPLQVGKKHGCGRIIPCTASCRWESFKAYGHRFFNLVLMLNAT